ncbi:MAG: type II toxin-antitoxin system YhaV family toxin [Leptolyngbyaceae cyanobacterium]
MSPRVVNGWEIYYHPLFDEQFQKLTEQVKQLSERLSEKKFKNHPTAKRYKAILNATDKHIPTDPLGDEFALTGNLGDFQKRRYL